jgi:hypothetical protein
MRKIEEFFAALLVAVAVLVGTAFFAYLHAVSFSTTVRAQDRDAAHAEHHDVYKTWMRPDVPTSSCCNERKVNGEGDVTGDCYPTDAVLKDGHWWARRIDTDIWLEIPDEKIIREINPDPTGTRAHLCESIYGAGVLCFVPPFGGG